MTVTSSRDHHGVDSMAEGLRELVSIKDEQIALLTDALERERERCDYYRTLLTHTPPPE